MIVTTVALPTNDRVDLMDGITGLVRIKFLSSNVLNGIFISTSNTATSDSNGGVQSGELVNHHSDGLPGVVLDWDSSVPLYAYGVGAGNKLAYAISPITSVGLSVNCS